jgi:hypothetical protein
MPDLRDLLSAEAERLRPDRIPPFPVILDRRRAHRRTTLLVSAVGLAAAVATGAAVLPGLMSDDERGLQQGGQVGAGEPAPDVLLVECGPAGPVLPNGARVSAQVDGVHYAFRNTTDAPLHFAVALGGDTLAAQSTRDITTSRVAPGEPSTVSCSDDVESLKAHQQPVLVEDPDHVYVAMPTCSGTTTIRDFGTPTHGDPVELTLRDHPRAEVVGYPQGSPRQVFTGALLIGWEGGGTSWTPSEVTDCTDTVPHVVASGIKAPPPTQLTHTDEFGLVKAVRRTGGALVVDVDRVDMLGGAEAASAAAAAGTDAPNDYFLRNDNPAVRTYTISSTTVVWGNIAMLHKEPGAQRTTLARWQDFVATSEATSTLFHFQIDDGQVVGIEEQYRP